jgi:hypothetical protein
MHSPFVSVAALCTLVTLSLPAQNASKAGATSRALDALLNGDSLWETPPAEFEVNLKAAKVQWLDQDKTRARFFGQGLQIFDGEIKPLEATCDFANGKLASSSISIYNRGDSTSKFGNAADFEKEVSTLKDIITAHLGVKPVDRGKDASSAVNAMGIMWTKSPTAYLLEYSSQKKSAGKDFRAEFIRLRVAPPNRSRKAFSPPAAHPATSRLRVPASSATSSRKAMATS